MLVNLSKTLQADDSSAIKSNIEYLKRSAVVGVPNCANAWAIFSLKWQVWKIFWSKWQVWIFGPNSPVKKEPSHDRKNAIALLDDLKSAMFYRPEPSPLDTIRAVAGELEQVRQKDSPVLKESARELAKAVDANAIAEVRSMAPELAKKLRPGEENRVRLLIAVSLLEHQAAASTIKPIAESLEPTDPNRPILLDLVAIISGTARTASPQPLKPAQICDAVGLLPAGSEVRAALIPLLDAMQAPLELRKIRDAAMDWFQAAGDRTTDWYKQNTQILIFMIALIVASISNADTFMFAGRFWRDPTLRAAMAKAAEKAASDPDLRNRVNATSAGQGAPVADTGHEAPGAAKKKPSSPTQIYDDLQTEIRHYGFPLGWYLPPSSEDVDQADSYDKAAARLGLARYNLDRANSSRAKALTKADRAHWGAVVEGARLELETAKTEFTSAKPTRETSISEKVTRQGRDMLTDPDVVASQRRITALAAQAEDAADDVRQAEGHLKEVQGKDQATIDLATKDLNDARTRSDAAAKTYEKERTDVQPGTRGGGEGAGLQRPPGPVR